MKQEYLNFYKNLYPWLTDEWQSTGADPGFGMVWWWLNLGTIEVSSLNFKGRVGFTKTPIGGHLFTQLRCGYPSILLNTQMALNIESADFETVKAEALRAANQLIEESKETLELAIADRDAELARYQDKLSELDR